MKKKGFWGKLLVGVACVLVIINFAGTTASKIKDKISEDDAPTSVVTSVNTSTSAAA